MAFRGIGRPCWLFLALAGCGQRTPAPAAGGVAARPAESAPAVASAKPAELRPTPPARVVRDGPCTPTSCDYRTETCCETTESEHPMSGCQKKASVAERMASGHQCTGEFAGDYVGIDCLSTADCQQGLSCCVAGEINHCGAECEEHEACVPGQAATCHAGSRCEASGSRSGGVCAVANPGTACGGKRCSGDEPACRYDRKKRRGECLALLPGGGWPDDPARPIGIDVALMRCTSPKDCAGERCCTGGPLPMTECSGACMSGIDVCDTVADCPEFLGPPVGCEAAPEGPPFLKTCRYAPTSP